MKGYLVLENGKVFEGKRFGAMGDVIAELVFTTGMTGYLETLTDKSYAGQMVVQTFPLIGNYGVIPSDFESDKIGPGGYIVKEWCQIPSNFRSEGNLDTFLLDRGIPALSGIDTRALTKLIRDAGALNACITDDPDKVDLAALKAYRITGKVAQVSTKQAYTVQAEQEKYNVVLLDYGVKASIIKELVKRGCTVTVLPHDTTAVDILAKKPDGILLSNGPGDPTENVVAIATIKELLGAGVPIFGICIGHQLLALANGFETGILNGGHRGSNQPVRNTETGKVYITSQGHQYVVLREGASDNATIFFEHVNDQSCEGIRYANAPAFSVQFHPEASAGPLDTQFLFDDFIKMMEG
ncbi:MAG: carbamoyl phosphate synthase small subunit [Oscillospiraceae bacterium]|nr:carbamoyl phosphate synthase small subunit [Oscillospiraceae bacterium]